MGDSVDKERTLLTAALTNHMMSNMPFSVAFQLFQRYCDTEAKAKTAPMNEEELAQMRSEFEENGVVIPTFKDEASDGPKIVVP